jgi:hypothetical protein
MMRMPAILLTVVATCSSYNVERRCIPNGSHAGSRAEFVLSCAENANPKSDEEPEDMLRECDRIARDTFCDHVWAVKCRGDSCAERHEWTPCKHAGPDGQRACKAVGW